jgi:integral membrane protein (TIGR00529 family)
VEIMLNLIGVIIAFIVIIILIRKRFNFGLSLILGSIIVGIFSLQEINPIEIPKAISKAIIYDFNIQVFDFQTIELAILLTIIYILARCMQETGAINKMIKSLGSIFYKGGILGLIPAVYGLMPVPGGALFSAPLIDKEGKKFKLQQNQKNFLNVWFRHIWFPIYPVSSAMLLIIGSDFANINIYEIIIADIPAFIAFIIIGLIYLKFYINRIPKLKKIPKKEYSGLLYLLPPIIPIIIYLLIVIIFEFIGIKNIKDIQRSIFIIGVILSIVTLYFLIDINYRKYFNIIQNSISFNLAFAIIGIMIFRQMIETSNANKIIASLIGELPFHAIFIIILIPLIMGLITGYNFGAIALSYFLVEPFFYYTNLNIVGIVSIIFISSLVGYLISPIHLCNVVSSDYLKTDTTRMYKMYIPAITMLLIIQTSFIVIFYGL